MSIETEETPADTTLRLKLNASRRGGLERAMAIVQQHHDKSQSYDNRLELAGVLDDLRIAIEGERLTLFETAADRLPEVGAKDARLPKGAGFRDIFHDATNPPLPEPIDQRIARAFRLLSEQIANKPGRTLTPSDLRDIAFELDPTG
jgi:hypothetical protein